MTPSGRRSVDLGHVRNVGDSHLFALSTGKTAELQGAALDQEKRRQTRIENLDLQHGPGGDQCRREAPVGHHLGADSHQVAPDSHQALVTIPADIEARLPAPGAKPRRKVLRQLILDLCALGPLSARELAAILRRTEHKPLVRDYLSPMVAEGALDYTIPEMESHPDQRCMKGTGSIPA